MNPLHEQALKLRIQGLSYNEIHKALGIPKGTLSGWFSKISLSEKAQQRLGARMKAGSSVLIKRNKMQTHHAEQRAKEARNAAGCVVNKLTKKDLLVLGTALYWGEGYKRLKVRDGKERMGHIISFVNSDPEMIQVFLIFLKEALDVKAEDVRLTMRLYPHINELTALHFWTKITNLPKTCFRKTTFLISRASKGMRPYTRLPYGTLQVAVYSTQKFHYLMGLIEGVKKSFACDIVQQHLPG